MGGPGPWTPSVSAPVPRGTLDPFEICVGDEINVISFGGLPPEIIVTLDTLLQTALLRHQVRKVTHGQSLHHEFRGRLSWRRGEKDFMLI